MKQVKAGPEAPEKAQLLSPSDSAMLLYIEPPFHDSSSNAEVIQALETLAAARLKIFTDIEKTLHDV